MRFALGLLALFGLSALASAMSNEDYLYHFGKFQVKYNKNYESVEEYNNRLSVFKENLDMINTHNAQKKSWALGVNEFADLTWDEFKATRLGLHVMPNKKTGTIVIPDNNNVNLPDTVDWRTKGVVNAVKNQGQCGSCWAFSATSSIESVCAIKTGKLLSLSEQQLVDCAGSYGPQGCNGGWMDDAFKYEKAAGGLCLESEYPYKGADGTCQADKCTKHCPLTGYSDVTKSDETALKVAVAQQPVSVAIEADQSGFQFYTSGVFDGTCGTTLDHGVVVEGYGTEGGSMYWLVRNSWGASWGEAGYIKLIRHDGQNNGQCGIALAASYPLM